MAVAEMKKMTLIALKKNHREILKSLQLMGNVHIIEEKVDEDLTSVGYDRVSEIEQELTEVRSAISFISKYDKSKKSIIKAKPAITVDKLDSFISNEPEVKNIIASIKAIDDRLLNLRANRARLMNKINALKLYISLDAPMGSIKETASTKMYLGVINTSSRNLIEDILNKYDGLVQIEVLDNDFEHTSIFAVAHKSVSDSFLSDLKTAYFSEFYTQGYIKTPVNIINEFENEAAKLNDAIVKTEEETVPFIEEIDSLKCMEDYYLAELDRAKAVNSLSGTAKTFVLQGWVIKGNEKKVEESLAKITGQYYIDFKDPEDGENYPVALVNSKLIRPFEAVLEMYSLPAPGALDPTALLAPFYFIFYGMMVSDAGYGIVLSILAIVLQRMMKPAGMFKKILGIITMTGISTFIWGALYGGWFGFSLPALWFNPIQEPMTMLVLCLALGMLHVSTGLITGAVISFKRGRWADAVCDKIFWLFLIWGLPMLAFGGLISLVGKYMALSGAVGIVLTNGRRNKGILKKFFGGLASLYNVSGYLSDVLSYSRIFGMGLATGVIAMVFNTIAGLLMGQWYLYILAAAVFLVGHSFNIGINALGAYVHSCRLMYIEFFSKFYEDGGKPYKPLAFRIKNYRLNN
ncbi:MAG: V-type ATP synthase subunit I [Eubacteriales bacterium]